MACYQNNAIRYHRYHTTLFVAMCVSKRVSFCVSKCVSASALLPIGIREKCHAVSKKSQEAFTARTRHPSGQIVTIGGTLPRPRCAPDVAERYACGACGACDPITRRYPVGACGVVGRHGISCVFLAGLWLVTVGNSVVMAGIGVVTG